MCTVQQKQAAVEQRAADCGNLTGQVIWGFPKSLSHFGDPCGRDYGILGSMLESPMSGNYHISVFPLPLNKEYSLLMLEGKLPMSKKFVH